MKVLLTSHRFHPHVGGTEEVVAQLARRLAARGHDVTVATMREPATPEEESKDGYAIKRFDVKQAAQFRFPPREYRDFVLQREWDVVHLHGQRVWSTDYLYRHLASAKSPLVFTAHGFYQWHMERLPGVDSVYYQFVMPRALKHCARVIALTANERDELELFGVPRERVILLADGYDAAEFERAQAGASGFRDKYGAPGKPLLLYVGGFYANKRVDRLVEAVAASKTGARLVAVGREHGGKYGREHCERRARELDVDFVHVGTLPRAEVLAGFREADLFLLASRFEGFGLVLLEAMASGLPFVSTPAGAAPELAAAGGGVIVKDAPEMGVAIRELLADAPTRQSIGEKAREAVKAYDWERIVDRHVALYEEVARR